MPLWTYEELDKIGNAEELAIAPRQRNGALRKPLPVWAVRVNDNLYVRSYRGRTGAWFRAAQAIHEGRIWTGGVEKDVVFVEETDPVINDQIDVVYRATYGRSPYVTPMVTLETRATTLRMMPHIAETDAREG
ncbi:DUF2255 family protein [Roseiflexus castenholzii]|uniref:DUF2255 family protein n=1 Tax=Roseiflexus castenholzii (strain DSM 13941 / HLO8) TaxID=383372 RepID=A7NI52_ROSCS|nr:DUF2255 family protein [Roseiflexus castenholzii]ABU57152.1 conserved hypothetical protein [Roseiflexus castenholzii DSM 13941]